MILLSPNAINPDNNDGGHMVTWVTRIRLPGGHEMNVQVRAPREPDAREIVRMQYREALIIAGPVRLDLMRAI